MNHNDLFAEIGLSKEEIDAHKAKVTPTFKREKIKVTAHEMSMIAKEARILALPIKDRIVVVRAAHICGETYTGCEDPNCNLGVWCSPKEGKGYYRACFRCKGKMHIDDKQAVSNNTYDMTGASGQREVSWEVYTRYNSYT